MIKTWRLGGLRGPLQSGGKKSGVLFLILVLVLFSRSCYLVSLGQSEAGSKFDVQMLYLVASLGLLFVALAATAVIPISSRLWRIGIALLISMYFLRLTLTAKVPKATELSRSLLNMLLLAFAVLFGSIIGIVVAFLRIPALRNRRNRRIIGAAAAVVLLIGVWRADLYLDVATERWPRGLLGRRLDRTGTCPIPVARPWLTLLPNRAMTFWTGPATCTAPPAFATLSRGKVTVTDCAGEHAVVIENPDYLSGRDQDLIDDRRLKYAIAAQPKEVVHEYRGEPIAVRSLFVEVRCGARRLLLTQIPSAPMLRRRIDLRPAATKPDHFNVVAFVLDCVSRAHFLRRLPRVAQVLESLPPRTQVHQFFRYTILGHATWPNMAPMVKGLRRNDASFLQTKSLFERFKEAGFMTLHLDDECLDNFNPEGNYGMPAEFRKKYVDYDPFTMYCHEDFDGTFARSNFKGPFSMRRRCLFGKNVHDYALEYLTHIGRLSDTTSTPFFAMIHLEEGHEGTGEVIGGMDGQLSEYLRDFFAEHGHNTIFVLMSDHGSHMGPAFMAFEYALIEHRLPLLYVMLPETFSTDRMQEVLRANEQKLVTPYDIHATLEDIASQLSSGIAAKNTTYGLSLLSSVVPERGCDEAHVPPEYCVCGMQRARL